MGLIMELLVVVWVVGQDSFEVVVGLDDLED